MEISAPHVNPRGTLSHCHGFYTWDLKRREQENQMCKVIWDIRQKHFTEELSAVLLHY